MVIGVANAVGVSVGVSLDAIGSSGTPADEASKDVVVYNGREEVASTSEVAVCQAPEESGMALEVEL